MSTIDPHSSTWAAVKGWAEREVARRRDALETPRLDAVASESLRGGILALNDLLQLAEPARRMPGQAGSPDPDY